MKLNGHELEFRYVGYINELQKIKSGLYGRNIWFFIIQLYLKSSLIIRLIKLAIDKRKKLIDSDSYNTWTKMIKGVL
jgi:hypothetical protein